MVALSHSMYACAIISCRNFAIAKLHAWPLHRFTEAEKEKLLKILVLDFMSSEETGSESGSGEEVATRRKIFLSRPLGWRSAEVITYFESLDRKVDR